MPFDVYSQPCTMGSIVWITLRWTSSVTVTIDSNKSGTISVSPNCFRTERALITRDACAPDRSPSKLAVIRLARQSGRLRTCQTMTPPTRSASLSLKQRTSHNVLKDPSYEHRLLLQFATYVYYMSGF